MLPGVDAPTFRRFCQWAYKGFYGPAKPTESLESAETTSLALQNALEANEIRVPELEEPVTGPHIPPVSRPETDNPPPQSDLSSSDGRWMPGNYSRGALYRSFVSREPTVRKSHISIPPARHNTTKDQDFTEVFLSHAKLYVFAEEKVIQPLKTLALEELHATLAAFDLHDCRTGDVLSLIEYVYENTSQLKRDQWEDLREVLADYMSWQMETLMKDEDFRSLAVTMKRNGIEFLDDVFAMVMKRLYKADIDDEE